MKKCIRPIIKIIFVIVLIQIIFSPTSQANWWDDIFNKGEEFTYDTINKLLELSDKEYINGLSILGGEPLHEFNILGTIKLAKAFKEKFPNKSLWAWSGYLFDKDLKDKEIAKYLDVIVDGRYEDDLRNPKLKWKGSENQRVIDVQKSLADSQIVLFKD